LCEGGDTFAAKEAPLLVAQQLGSKHMKKLKVRSAALTLGALVAGSTAIGAVAYQGDTASPATEPQAADAAAFPVMDSEPIVYSGSYGLFPSK
jgi:hypothetical protein